MEELNSGPPKTSPSSGREEDLNPGPPDYKSRTLPLGHVRLPDWGVGGSTFCTDLFLGLSFCGLSFRDTQMQIPKTQTPGSK